MAKKDIKIKRKFSRILLHVGVTKNKVKSSYQPSGPPGQSLSWFLQLGVFLLN